MADPHRGAPPSTFEFVSCPTGDVFVAKTDPPEGVRLLGSVLFLPSFGEEMNKSRRMVAMQRRALASLGYSVWSLDLPGCGDSRSSLESVEWQDWVDAALICIGALSDEADQPITLWGHRLGALLCAHVFSVKGDRVDRLLLWQPVLDGKSTISGLRRIARASEFLGDNNRSPEREKADTQHASEKGIEVGGYVLSSALVSSIEVRAFRDYSLEGARVDWIDVGARDRTSPLPAAANLIEDWQAAGVSVHWSHVRGEAFWSTVEIAECPALIDKTCDVMR